MAAGNGRSMIRYLRVKSGTVAETLEAVPGKVYVDLDVNGRVLGVEVLEEPSAAEVVSRKIAEWPEWKRKALASVFPHRTDDGRE